MTAPEAPNWLVGESDGQYVGFDASTLEFGSFLAAIDAVTEAARVTVDEHGLSTDAVDPANILRVRPELAVPIMDPKPTDGESFEVGLKATELLEAMPRATGQNVLAAQTLHVHVSEEVARVRRGIGGAATVLEDHKNIDTDSIRDPPEDGFERATWEATVSRWAFVEAVEECCRATGSAVRFEEHQGSLRLRCYDGSRTGAVADFGGDAEPAGDTAEPGAGVTVGSDYLSEVAEAIDHSDGDLVELRWSDDPDRPLTIVYGGSTDELTGASMAARFDIAPRKHSDGTEVWGETA